MADPFKSDGLATWRKVTAPQILVGANRTRAALRRCGHELEHPAPQRQILSRTLRHLDRRPRNNLVGVYLLFTLCKQLLE